MEEDLRAFIPSVVHQPDPQLALSCEMLVRTYDPCISCATHFLRLDVRRE
jgi:coenzyme F420-reducing hydrogenase alpha subunit